MSSTRALTSALPRPGSWVISGSAMMSPTVMRGSSAASGSWNTICIARRCRRSASASRRAEVVAEPDHAPGARLDQAEHGAAEGRLAAARFADDAERLAGAQLEADAVDRLERQVAAPQQAADRDREMDREVLDLEQRLAHGSPPDGRPWPGRGANSQQLAAAPRQRSNAKAQRSRNAQPPAGPGGSAAARGSSRARPLAARRGAASSPAAPGCTDAAGRRRAARSAPPPRSGRRTSP